MESIGEKLRTLLPIKKESRAGQFDLESEALSKARDIFSTENPLLTHVAKIDDLPDILQMGLISKSLAEKIGQRYPKYVLKENDVWFGVGRVMTAKSERQFAILAAPTGDIIDSENIPIDGPLKNHVGRYVTVKRRVAPKEFVGIMVIQPKRKGQVIRAIKTTRAALPVYDDKGNLIWPKRMSHEEIVQMLAERQT